MMKQFLNNVRSPSIEKVMKYSDDHKWVQVAKLRLEEIRIRVKIERLYVARLKCPDSRITVNINVKLRRLWALHHRLQSLIAYYTGSKKFITYYDETHKLRTTSKESLRGL